MLVTFGLVLFVAVVAVSAAVLLFDLGLLVTGRQTITARVRARPVLGLPILAFLLLGVIGLALHFYGL